MPVSVRSILVLVAASCAWSAADAQLLRGVVSDTTGRGVAGVDVIMEGTQYGTRTDSAGRYRIEARRGDFSVLYRLLGYHPTRSTIRLDDRDTLTRDITLIVADAQQLDPVTVKAPTPRGTGLEAFEERRRLGLGSFLDSVVLRRSEGRRLGDLARELRGLRIVHRGNEQYATIANRMDSNGGAACFSTVWLDRQIIYRSGSRDPLVNLSRDFPIMSLEAVEWYARGAQVPMEFARYSDCGVLVLWTRRGR
ncbi:MAG TPA: carboxypeptidase-like regulatory domain-containing protein [Gemmatimonadaceae bacterium]|nr:carboxypeptidase-like regulatory domain-containing protein [Gemmatimonadaceae bacterium]